MNRRFSQDRAELEAHFAELVQTYLDLGMSDEEATHQAQQKFGDLNRSLRQLRYQHYVLSPLKAARFAIYWSLRATLDYLVICLIGVPIYWLLSLFAPDGAHIFLVLLLSAPSAGMFDAGYLLDAQYPRYKHWGVFGAFLFWMGIYLVGMLLFSPKNKPLNFHALWLLLPMLLAAPYFRIPWRKNAKPTV